MIEGHGDDIFRYGEGVRVNFSTNIHQNVDHSGLVAHLAAQGDIFRNYPEPEPRGIEAMLAHEEDVAPGCVTVTNGATEAIYLLAHMGCGGVSAVVAPTFREYQDACRVFGHRVTFVSDPGEAPEDTDMVWLCNPNNPTGSVIDVRRLLDVIDGHPQWIFVVDQAYAGYSMRRVLTSAEVTARPNVVVLSSLTKRFAVPGLRIGYAVGSESVIGRMRGLKMPWSVNSMAIEGARYLLEHQDEYMIDAVAFHREAIRMAGAMRGMGITVWPTECNFLLCGLADRSAHELKEWLVARHGLLIRDASNFEGLGARHFRVAAQSREENDMLIEALREWIAM